MTDETIPQEPPVLPVVEIPTTNAPLIETLINTSALALTSFGVAEILKTNYYGFAVVVFGMALEFAKYYGRQKQFWGN